MSTDSELDRDPGGGGVANKRPGRRVNGNIVAVGAVFGLVYLILGLVQGEPVAGLIAMGFMLVFVALYVVGAKFSDTIALMGDDVSDERHVHIHQRAALITVNVLGFAVVVGAIVDFAQGGNGAPYTWLAGVLVVTYFGVVFLLSRRN